MAKSTHSQEILTGTADSYTETESAERPFPRYNRPELGTVDQPVTSEEEETEALNRVTDETDSDSDDDSEEDKEESTWVGGSSTQSSKSNPKPDEISKQRNPKPAPTTESPSSQTAQEDFIADSTDGNGQREERKPSPRRISRAPRSRSVDDEFDI